MPRRGALTSRARERGARAARGTIAKVRRAEKGLQRRWRYRSTPQLRRARVGRWKGGGAGQYARSVARRRSCTRELAHARRATCAWTHHAVGEVRESEPSERRRDEEHAEQRREVPLGALVLCSRPRGTRARAPAGRCAVGRLRVSEGARRLRGRLRARTRARARALALARAHDPSQLSVYGRRDRRARPSCPQRRASRSAARPSWRPRRVASNPSPRQDALGRAAALLAPPRCAAAARGGARAASGRAASAPVAAVALPSAAAARACGARAPPRARPPRPRTHACARARAASLSHPRISHINTHKVTSHAHELLVLAFARAAPLERTQ